jgi:hypothetical protein
MPVRVVIARHGGSFLQDWEEEEHPPLKEDQWEQAARLWPGGLLSDSANPPEVFLCLDPESLAENYETDLLGKVIRKAHASMWGANLYVVVDKRLRIEEQHELDDIRREWFEVLLKNGVSDVLEMNVNKISAKLLQVAAKRAQARSETLKRHIPSMRWKCLVPEFWMDGELFLGDFSTDVLPEDSSNCLIALRDCTDSRREFVADALKKPQTGKVLVGLLDAVDISWSQEFEDQRKLEQRKRLEQLCKDHFGRLIIFHGLFELHYFLQRLDAVYEKHEVILKHAEIVSVRQNFFSPHAPQLLVTHSFNPGDHTGAVAAARDVYTLYTLRRELCDKFEIVVHPAMQITGFYDRLKELKQLLAWVHIGHGDGANGLQQAGGLYKSAQEWIACLAEHHKSLSLAVFSSCTSGDVARKFAEAGVGVTIGFRKNVPKNLCGEMTVKVVEAAFYSGGNRDKIIDAFQRVKGMFPNEEPVIFCARH